MKINYFMFLVNFIMFLLLISFMMVKLLNLSLVILLFVADIAVVDFVVEIYLFVDGFVGFVEYIGHFIDYLIF